MCSHSGCHLLIDTGTYLNYVPKNWFQKAFPKTLFNLDEILCKDWKQMPDVVIKLKDTDGKEIKLKLTGEQYMDQTDEGEFCTTSICPDDIEFDLITLGQVFLRNYYTIFNFEKGK